MRLDFDVRTGFWSLTGLSFIFFVKMKTQLTGGLIDTWPFFWVFLEIVLLRKYEGLEMKLAKTLRRHFFINCPLSSSANIELSFTLYETWNKMVVYQSLMKRNQKTILILVLLCSRLVIRTGWKSSKIYVNNVQPKISCIINVVVSYAMFM